LTSHFSPYGAPQRIVFISKKKQPKPEMSDDMNLDLPLDDIIRRNQSGKKGSGGGGYVTGKNRTGAGLNSRQSGKNKSFGGGAHPYHTGVSYTSKLRAFF
jgi:hypothetical protein